MHVSTVTTLAGLLRARGHGRNAVALVPGAVFTVSGLRPDALDGGCTFVFSLFAAAPPQSEATLVEVSDDRHAFLSVRLLPRALRIRAESRTADVPLSLPLGEWSSAAVTLQPDGDEWHFCVAGRDVALPLPRWGRKLVFSIGGVSEVATQPILLGSASLFRRLDGAEAAAVGAGERPPSVMERALFHFVPVQRESAILLKSVAPPGVTCTGRAPAPEPSFAAILVDRCRASLLTPLFAQWALPYRAGGRCRELPLLTTQVLEAALARSEEAQLAFVIARKVMSLSYLLQQYDSDVLTFDVYQHFHALFQRLSNDALKHQLFRCVLTNLALWTRASADTNVRVLQHWKTRLFPSYATYAAKRRPFDWLVTAADRYYRQSDGCRRLLFEVALSIAQTSFRPIDLVHLIAATVEGAADTTAERLDLLNGLARLPAALASADDALRYFSVLLDLVAGDNAALAVAGLVTVFDLARCGHVPDMTANDIVFAVMNDLPPRCATRAFFDRVVDLSAGDYPALFPLASWLALNFGSAAVSQLYARLPPSPRFVTGKRWPFWALVTVYSVSAAVAGPVLAFLVRATWPRVRHLLACAEVVAHLYTADDVGLASVHAAFVAFAADARPRLERSHVIEYFAALRHYLFVAPPDARAAHTAARFAESPFAPPAPVGPAAPAAARAPDGQPPPVTRRLSVMTRLVRTPSKRRVIFTCDVPGAEENAPADVNAFLLFPANFSQRLSAIAPERFAAGAGIRIGVDGRWKDAELAESALGLFANYKIKELVPLAATIAGFLLHERGTIEELVIPLFDPSDKCDAFAFYDYHAGLTGHRTIQGLSPEQCAVRAFAYIDAFAQQVDDQFAKAPAQFAGELRDLEAGLSVFGSETAACRTEIVGVADSTLCEFDDAVAREYSSAARDWHRYFHCVTIERAPWQNCCTAESRQRHFMRDFTICVDNFSPKVKPNFKFNRHEDAVVAPTAGPAPEQSVDATRERLQQKLVPSNAISLVKLRQAEKVNGDAVAKTVCLMELPCEIIKAKGTTPATFILTGQSLVLSKHQTSSMAVIPLSEISEIYLRTRFHRLSAIELFLVDGESYFLNFPNVDSASIARLFRGLQMPKLSVLQQYDFKTHFSASKFMDRWVTRRLTTFQYLMLLNKCSGRSFNDISQYPVFPWILADYSSPTLNFFRDTVFRDLSKPVGSLDDTRLRETLEMRRELIAAGVDPYMYSSGYSCPLHIGLWMLRLEPFTQVHIDIQGGHFDLPARLFSSVREAYRLCTTMHNDYRELIPEFFGAPEFLRNADGFDLGAVDGRALSDVALPPWAGGSAADFVYLNRKALESEFVSKNLQHWIDLVWGDKQRGERAVVAHNVFVKDLYADVWASVDLSDDGARAAAELLLCHFGQIPPQLFDRAHPQRDPPRERRRFAGVRGVSIGSRAITAAHVYPEGPRARLFLIDDALRCQSSVVDLADAVKIKLRLKSEVASAQSSGAVGKGVSCRMHCFWRDGFAFVAGASDLMHARAGAVHAEKVLQHRTPIVCVAADGDWVSVADGESSFSLYRASRHHFSIPIFKSAVRASAVSAAFKLVVCGTRDGALLFCSLNLQIVVRVVELGGGVPVRVLITPAWGFVCVYIREVAEGILKHFIALYTVNGEKVRQVEIQGAIVAWSCWADDGGFDFMAIALEDGECHFFEAFWLVIGEAACDVCKSVVGIGFAPALQAGVIVSSDGQVIVVPTDDGGTEATVDCE
jgi:hypothetical protein